MFILLHDFPILTAILKLQQALFCGLQYQNRFETKSFQIMAPMVYKWFFSPQEHIIKINQTFNNILIQVRYLRRMWYIRYTYGYIGSVPKHVRNHCQGFLNEAIDLRNAIYSKWKYLIPDPILIYISQYRVWAPRPISDMHLTILGLDQNTSEIGVKCF